MLIVMWGKDDEGKVLSSTELFDSTNGQWFNCSDLPHLLYWLQSVIIGNILYMLGGANTNGVSSSSMFH